MSYAFCGPGFCFDATNMLNCCVSARSSICGFFAKGSRPIGISTLGISIVLV